MKDKILLECELLVAGGGPAGVSCAITAARLGTKVILCQDRPVLGGNASSEIRMHIVGADGVMAERSKEGEVEARESGLIEEIRLDACLKNQQRSPSMFDLLLYDKCRSEENLTLLLNTTVCRVTMEGDKITSVSAERSSTEDNFEIQAALFVDCTGDGRLGLEAGAEFRMGREGRLESGEADAPAEPDKKTLGSTLLFMAKKHPGPMPFTPPKWARKFDEEMLRLRPHASPGFEYGLEYGYWWLEWGGELDTIKENEAIRDELLAILLGVWDHIKNGGDHGAENWALEWCGFLPGKRESRRFVGDVILSENDILNSTPWEDAIAYGGWPIDTHPPEGVDAPDQPPCTQLEVPRLYDIPLRACISRNVRNLMFAGRNISATHRAFASTRVMATCSVVGQGVGTAAACAIVHQCEPMEIVRNPRLRMGVQQCLLAQDCFLIGLSNQDKRDHAREASVTASSSRDDAPPEAVLSGVTRSVFGDRGAPPGRTAPGRHRWISSGELPAWIQLEWPEPKQVGFIQIIFDSGLHRLLTFSLAAGVNSRMHWGEAPPEMVRDYQIEIWVDASWRKVVEVFGNHQRRVSHELPEPSLTPKIRITGLSDQSGSDMRIVEVRVYSTAGEARQGFFQVDAI